MGEVMVTTGCDIRCHASKVSNEVAFVWSPVFICLSDFIQEERSVLGCWYQWYGPCTYTRVHVAGTTKEPRKVIMIVRGSREVGPTP